MTQVSKDNYMHAVYHYFTSYILFSPYQYGALYSVFLSTPSPFTCSPPPPHSYLRETITGHVFLSL